MDDKKCVRSNFAFMPSEIRADFYTGNKNLSIERENQLGVYPNDNKKCRGDILYLKNPLFKNVPSKLNDDKRNCKTSLSNSEHHNISDNYFHLLFSQKLYDKNSCIARGSCEKKSRKEGMKARAEIRRDILLTESSDDDYSSINTSKDLKSQIKSHRNSSTMDDAYNRRSRSARTERYFRRLSREDNYRDYDPTMTNYGLNIPKKTQDVRFPMSKPSSNPGRKIHCEINPSSLFLDRDDNFLKNPIYKSSGNNSPVYYDKYYQRETTEQNRIYDKYRKSDPGGEAILAYKNKKSPRALDRLRYNEPQILNYEEPKEYYQRLPINPKKVVRRSYSFQHEIPRDYETGKNYSTLTKARNPASQFFKSIPQRTPDISGGDFQVRKLYPQKKQADFSVGSQNEISSSSILMSKVIKDDKTTKKRNSKDLGKELSELEEMYTSLRLSDDNLLERAEERCAEEFSMKSQSSTNEANSNRKYLSSSSSSESILGEYNLQGDKKYSQKSSEAHVKNDDMAYRKMQPKKMPALSETQNSLSQISYLLASSALILGEEIDYPIIPRKSSKEEPNITKDDMVYRNLHYANNVLRVIDPQPPFGIPLRPATPSTNSNYLCSSPVATKSPKLKYLPQSEPNIVTDDLAFRNLRKDAPKTPPVINDCCDNGGTTVSEFSFVKNDLAKSSLDDETFIRKKKKAVRSLSANLYGLISEVNNLELNIK